MKRNMFKLLMTALPVFALLSSGCGNQPDPRANPNFNEEAFNNPSAVKMEPMKKAGKR